VLHDEGVRETSLEVLAGLKTVAGENGVHTAATSSQISDGASAVLLMSADAAAATGLNPLATVVDVTLIGSDPVLMLTGPIYATRGLLAANKLVMADVDVVEINEAFASVVLAWERELKPDMATVNPTAAPLLWDIHWALPVARSSPKPPMSWCAPMVSTPWSLCVAAGGWEPERSCGGHDETHGQ
jgi:acetyl-CoA C-acetyltransferase